MRILRFSAARAAFTVVVLVCAMSARPALAKDPPSDLCTLLDPAELQKALGHSFGAAEKSTAPAAYRGQSSGTHCEYAAEKGADVKMVFIG